MALTLGVLALVEAKPGKEAEVEAFVKAGQSIVEQEPGTRVWYGFRSTTRRSGSSMPSRTKPRVRRTCPGRSRPRWPPPARGCLPRIRISAWSTSSRSRARRFGGWARLTASRSMPGAGRGQSVVRLGQQRNTTSRNVASLGLRIEIQSCLA